MKRTASVFAVALAMMVGISSCTADDTERESVNLASPDANKPKVTVTAQRGGAAPQQQQQAASDALSEQLMSTEIKSLDGDTFKLADYKDKVVLLDLWATWCGPCRLEVPHLVELSKEYGSKGVEVLGLTLENPATDEQKVRDFADEFKINYKIGWARADFARELMRGNGSIPQTFVIAPGGRIVAHYRGFSNSLPERLRADLDKATDRTTGD